MAETAMLLMPMWSQHLLVLLAAGACFAIVATQGLRTLRGKKSKLGSCCAKGCDAEGSKTTKERIVFMPVEMLRKK